MSRATRAVITKTNIEARYDVELRMIGKNRVVAVDSKQQSEPTRKKRKRKNAGNPAPPVVAEQEKSLPSLHQVDVVKFGERVDAPPKLTSAPRIRLPSSKFP